MSHKVRLWGALGPIGLRGEQIEQASDGSVEIPYADAAEVAKAFGLTDIRPEAPSKQAPKAKSSPPAVEAAVTEAVEAKDESEAPPLPVFSSAGKRKGQRE